MIPRPARSRRIVQQEAVARGAGSFRDHIPQTGFGMSQKRNATDDPAPIRVHARRKIGVAGCIAIIFGIAAVLLLVPVVIYLAWSQGAARRVEAKLAELRAAGEPATAADLYTIYRVPAGADNVTQLWTQAGLAFDNPDFSQRVQGIPIVGTTDLTIPPPGTSWPEKDATAALLAEYETELKMIHEAVQRGGEAQFPLKFEDGFNVLLPNTQRMRSCARMISLEAHVRAHDGDARGAAESIRAALQIGNGVKREPILVSHLVRIALDGIGHQLIRDQMPHIEFAEDDLRQMQQILRSADYRAECKRALQGERVLGSMAFRDRKMARTMGAPGVSFGVGARNEDLLLYLDCLTSMVNAMDKPWPTALDEVDKIQQKINATAKKSALTRARYALTLMSVPAVDAVVAAGARADSSRQMVDAAIAIELFRRTEGRIPAQLNELVPQYLPAVPIDAFDGQPIRYVVGEKKFTLYSIGRDRTDNGGDGGESGFDPDVVLTMPIRAADRP